MTNEDLARLIERRHELRGVEFKRPGMRTDRELMGWVTRAALGMANHRDGGLIVIGMDDSGEKLQPIGLTSQELASWTYDDIAATLAASSDPTLSFESEVLTYDGKPFVILSVHEFAELPILAKKDVSENHKRIIRKGGCYVRSLGKPETSEIPSQDEMRDLLDLAIQKGVRKFVERAVGAGLIVYRPLTGGPASEARFSEQLGDLR